ISSAASQITVPSTATATTTITMISHVGIAQLLQGVEPPVCCEVCPLLEARNAVSRLTAWFGRPDAPIPPDAAGYCHVM
ncbi:MAG TPA: hypothetical protein VJX66_14770, partial [Amycolatopsis sp.]|nr:hypothetical protein [Amycolatopsis sp.]